jgi:filamentous hemagglutinin
LIVQIPVGEKDQNKVQLRDEIMKLANQPGNAYLKDFVNRKDVDWQKVILAQKDWDYKSQGLTAAGAAILAIAIAAVSGGAGIGAIFGTTGTVTNAALLSLTTQASISLVNNGGNISATFKELGSKESVKSLAITVVTAGLVEGMSASLKIDLQGFPTAEKIANNFVQGVGSTLISSTLQGESLSDGLQKALLVGLSSSLQGEMASKIKGLEDVDYILHKVAHAAAGCISGALLKSCEAGAIGAVVGEIVASSIDTPDSFSTFDELAKHQKLVRDISKLTAGVVAAYTGYDVNVAANSAEIAIRNNRQLNENEIKSIDILAKGDSQKKID